MRLTLRAMIGLSVIGSIVIALTLVATFTFLKADDNLVKLTEDQRAFVAGQIRAQMQIGFGLGLELASQTNIEQVIGAVAARYPRLRSIEVFDDGGQVLFAAGPAPGAMWFRRRSAGRCSANRPINRGRTARRST